MPERKIARMVGMDEEVIRSHVDFSPSRHLQGLNMTDNELRKFEREEKEIGHHHSAFGQRY